MQSVLSQVLKTLYEYLPELVADEESVFKTAIIMGQKLDRIVSEIRGKNPPVGLDEIYIIHATGSPNNFLIRCLSAGAKLYPQHDHTAIDINGHTLRYYSADEHADVNFMSLRLTYHFGFTNALLFREGYIQLSDAPAEIKDYVECV